MWLIHTTTLQLEEFYGTVPEYAILSHTWGSEEVTFEEFSQGQGTAKLGYDKITNACLKARIHGIGYCWVDTCCIAKSSSAELTEAINSMFNWYKLAKRCYVFLADLGETDDDTTTSLRLEECRWFSRGWCLQELIAPKDIRFYDSGWNCIGTKDSLRQVISDLTGIDHDVLEDSSRLFVAPVARRMSWASKRQTTRVEDMAYSLLGIFDVNMPMLYGEGGKAFIRLQEEIIKKSNDMSIFAWKPGSKMGTAAYVDMFAPSPAFFDECHHISSAGQALSQAQFSISNRGVTFVGDSLYVLEAKTSQERADYVILLDCWSERGAGGCWKALFLKKIGPGLYVRANSSGDMDNSTQLFLSGFPADREMHILARVTPDLHPIIETCHRSSFQVLMTGSEMFIPDLEPRAAWDGPRSRFLTLGDLSFVSYMKIGAVLNMTVMAEFFVGLRFGVRGEPLVCLVHPDVWASISGAGLRWSVTNAIEQQQRALRGVANELRLGEYKAMASLETVDEGGVKVHRVALSYVLYEKGIKGEGGV